MKVFFLSTECFPIAKVGGLADVVGALPKYLKKIGAQVSVVLPKYDLPWFEGKEFNTIYANKVKFPKENIPFSVEQYKGTDLGYDFFVIDIPGKFDRKGVYADLDGVFFPDETERYISMQRAFLQWIKSLADKPDIIHCHDHHTGLVPFMMQHTKEFKSLVSIPTVFSIHNERYQGIFPWHKSNLLPEFSSIYNGLLDWDNAINPLASAVKCCWKLNTVSPTYMKELQENSFGLEWLFQNEKEKSQGILNGIDTEVWNPKTDTLLDHPMLKNIKSFKSTNKNQLLETYGLEKSKTLISFIGRFALEKGADILPSAIEEFIINKGKAVFLILGTGMPEVEKLFKTLSEKYPKKVVAIISYDEKVSHEIYAGSDFMVMPSRVEPCGLNQMYAMRYGTIPIVRDIGGLKDSVQSIALKNGTGIKFEKVTVQDINKAFDDATSLYAHKKEFETIRQAGFDQDFSWEQSARKYLNIYHELNKLCKLENN